MNEHSLQMIIIMNGPDNVPNLAELIGMLLECMGYHSILKLDIKVIMDNINVDCIYFSSIVTTLRALAVLSVVSVIFVFEPDTD